MTTVRHPRFDESREVPDEDVARWVRAGWLAPEPEPAEQPRRRRKPRKQD